MQQGCVESMFQAVGVQYLDFVERTVRDLLF